MPSEHSPHLPSAPKPAPAVVPVWLHALRRNVESLTYGTVQVVVHDGRVREIDVTEKTRIDNSRTRSSSAAAERRSDPAPGAGTAS